METPWDVTFQSQYPLSSPCRYPLWRSVLTRTQTETYYTGTDLAPNCRVTELPPELKGDPAAGGACFTLQGDESSVHIDISDVTGLTVGGAYEWLSPSEDAIGAYTFFCGSTDAEVIGGAAKLVVYVGGPVTGPAACAVFGTVGATGTTGTITATFELEGSGIGPIVDSPRDCLEPAPEAASISGITDNGSDVDLSVRVLLDGVTLERGQAIFAKAAESYAPLGITLSPTGFETVDFSGTDGYGLINQAKDRFDGSRPAGSDLVFTLTTKNIVTFGLGDIAGQADCVGGVRYPERAFAVGETTGVENLEFFSLRMYMDAAAKIAGHEIGHLMGAQHHYANCAEGKSRVEEGWIEPAPCSLMFNSIDFMATNFDAVNGVVVRGHAVQFASP